MSRAREIVGEQLLHHPCTLDHDAGLPLAEESRDLGDPRVVAAEAGVLRRRSILPVQDEVRRCGPQHMLVVLDGVREILIPAVAPILRADAALSGPLVIDPPEGLLDVAGD